mgnify:FL=1
MAKVKLAKHRATGPLNLRRGGEVYALTALEETNVPLSIAVGMLGDEALVVEFDSSDKKDVLDLNEYLLEILKREFNIEGEAKDVQSTMFPETSIINKVKQTIAPTPPVVEEPVVEEETVEGEVVEQPQEDLSKLTVKQLKARLEEKGLSTDGLKADLVARLSSAGDE